MKNKFRALFLLSVIGISLVSCESKQESDSVEETFKEISTKEFSSEVAKLDVIGAYNSLKTLTYISTINMAGLTSISTMNLVNSLDDFYLYSKSEITSIDYVEEELIYIDGDVVHVINGESNETYNYDDYKDTLELTTGIIHETSTILSTYNDFEDEDYGVDSYQMSNLGRFILKGPSSSSYATYIFNKNGLLEEGTITLDETSTTVLMSYKFIYNDRFERKTEI